MHPHDVKDDVSEKQAAAMASDVMKNTALLWTRCKRVSQEKEMLTVNATIIIMRLIFVNVLLTRYPSYTPSCPQLGILYFILEIPNNLYAAHTTDPAKYKLSRYVTFFLLATYSGVGTLWLYKFCMPMLKNLRKKAKMMFKLRCVRSGPGIVSE